MVSNQGLQGVAFFEATACLTLLVLFIHLRRDNSWIFYKLWLFGWISLTLASFAELAFFFRLYPSLHLLVSGATVAALTLFLASILHLTLAQSRFHLPMFWLAGFLAVTTCYFEGRFHQLALSSWVISTLECALALMTGFLLWRSSTSDSGHGGKLLAGGFVLLSLNGLDRPYWAPLDTHLIRFAFDHFLFAGLGIGMIMLLLENARARSEEISEKMRQFTLLTASSSQSVALPELLRRVLREITGSLGATHGLIRLLEGKDNAAEFVVRASIGFSDSYLKQNARFTLAGPRLQELLKQGHIITRVEDEPDVRVRRNMGDAGISQLVMVPLRGKERPVGLLNIGVPQGKRFHEDEIAYLVNVANFLGTTVENVNLFEQVKTVEQQWVYTFDSMGDPILVHDEAGRVVRANLRLADLLRKDTQAMIGRSVCDLFPPREAAYQVCPYCEGISGEADSPDPWLRGYFLVSNSSFTDPGGRKLGTIHVLKDITERKRAEEKYRTLVASVQEGVFITTVQGRFLDFNSAMMRILGYENRDELMRVDISHALYVNLSDRERVRKLLQEHGSVADFEFEIRRKDGEIRVVSESSTAIRDSAGNVTAYQGFLLDVTERRRAEQEIRRRNRELLVLNSLAEALVASLDLADSVQRSLRQIIELFGLDASALYLLDRDGLTVRRIASIDHRSEFAKNFPSVTVPPEFIQQMRAVRATFLSVQGLALPAVAQEIQRKEGIESAYLLPLWSKDKIIGALAVGSRSVRELSSADSSLLIAVASQIASAVERNQLYDETRSAYENLRRTQEQLVHSEKLAAVGQLISGVAHELNNPLTAILGYSQLLTSSGQAGPQALEYSEKMYKQAQRTQRIVQNLLSFARQHKPERSAINLNAILEDTLALRDYDLRMSHIRVHLELSPDLPLTSADPHQLQQVFLNLINNAVDAILENGQEGDLWVRTGVEENTLHIEFADSGSGVKDASKVFDPFYTTKPVGKGTGLGLSICYGIISEHGGAIRVRNVAGQGASFRIELPRQFTPAGREPFTADSPRSVLPARLLVVDAEESLLESVATALRGASYIVETAKSLVDARALAQGREFDLLLTDLELVRAECPGFQSVKLDADRAKLGLASRFLWLLSQPSKDGQRNGFPVPEGAILQKPFLASELLAAVELQLTRSVAPLVQK